MDISFTRKQHLEAQIRLLQLQKSAEPMKVRKHSYESINEAREKLAELQARVDYHKVEDD